MNDIEVSVIMAVHNANLSVLKNSVNSIFNQSYKNFEFIIIDDINDANTTQFLENLKNQILNVHIIKNEKNIGLTQSLIKGIAAAKGKYIARQDADDFSFPTRLEKQVEFLRKNKEVVLLGTGYILEQNKKKIKEYSPPIEHVEILEYFLFSNPFCHTSVIFCKSAYQRIGGYNEKFIYSQDFELWPRFRRVGRLANLSDRLVVRSVYENSVSKKLNVAMIQIYVGLLVRIRERKMFDNKFFFVIILSIACRHLLITILGAINSFWVLFIEKINKRNL